mmetsp:Transcript_25563/g.51159  ORF Transcript_25563/g.51159 Transcript_25563/m.51159 type:complete len:224 (-) Transcript_25563:91-762(-)
MHCLFRIRSSGDTFCSTSFLCSPSLLCLSFRSFAFSRRRSSPLPSSWPSSRSSRGIRLSHDSSDSTHCRRSTLISSSSSRSSLAASTGAEACRPTSLRSGATPSSTPSWEQSCTRSLRTPLGRPQTRSPSSASQWTCRCRSRSVSMCCYRLFSEPSHQTSKLGVRLGVYTHNPTTFKYETGHSFPRRHRALPTQDRGDGALPGPSTWSRWSLCSTSSIFRPWP